MTHWTDAYIGIPYNEEEFDCVSLLVRVQSEVFGRTLKRPLYTESNFILKSRQLELTLLDKLEPVTDEPIDGDAVLMRSRGRISHIGVFARIHGIPYVLHNVKVVNSVILTRISRLYDMGMEVEGYYRCRVEPDENS